MTIRKTLTLLALPVLLISGEAAARPCPYVGCGTEIGDAQSVASQPEPAPPFAMTIQMSGAAAKRDPMLCSEIWCGMNGPELTGAHAPSAPATTIAVRLPSRLPNGVDGSCPPFACGSESNGPALTGIALRRPPFPVPAPQPRPVPVPYPNGRPQ